MPRKAATPPVDPEAGPGIAPTLRDRVVELRRVRASDLVPNPKNWRLHHDAQRHYFSQVVRDIGFAGAVLARPLPDGRLMLLDGHLRAEELGDASVPVLVTDLDEGEADLLLATYDPLGRLAGTDQEAVATLLASLEATGRDAGVTLLHAVAEHDQTAALLESLADSLLAMHAPPAPLAPLVPAPDGSDQNGANGHVAPRRPVDDPGGGGDAYEPEPAEEAAAEPRVRPGDLWQLGAHRLLCGDSTNRAHIARLMDGAKARLVVTSPPYNQQLDTFKPSGMQKENPAFVKRMASSYADSLPEAEYQDAQVAFLEMLPRFLTPDASIFYNHKIRYREKAVLSPMQWLSRLSYPIRQEIIWDRSSSITLNARMFMPADERIYWLRVGDDFLFNDTAEIKAWGTVWTIAARNEVQVSAAFAVEIPARCVQAASEPGDIVLEPYGGSGTTLIACERLGRVCYINELNPRYCDVILRRWEAETGREAELLERIDVR